MARVDQYPPRRVIISAPADQFHRRAVGIAGIADWRRKGDGVFSALAESDRQVVLAIDELPILVDRLLKASGEVQPRWKTWSASTLTKCSPSGDRWTWNTTRPG